MKEMRLWWSFRLITLTNSPSNQFNKKGRFPLCNEFRGVKETQRRPTVATVERKSVGWKKVKPSMTTFHFFKSYQNKLKKIM